MVMPMTQFMGDREALSTVVAILLDGDNRLVGMADDPRLAAVEGSVPDRCIDMKGDRLEIDLARFCYPKLLQEPLGRRRLSH